jgi:hypothetical protein
MFRRKDLQMKYGLREVLFFAAAGTAICLVAALLLTN